MKSGDGKPKPMKKDCPLCTHCGVLGHTQDRCFKLNGFPPGYDKFKGKPAPAQPQVHHVAKGSSASMAGLQIGSVESTSVLTSTQVQQLLSLLQLHQHGAQPDTNGNSSVLAGMVFSASIS